MPRQYYVKESIGWFYCDQYVARSNGNNEENKSGKTGNSQLFIYKLVGNRINPEISIKTIYPVQGQCVFEILHIHIDYTRKKKNDAK